MSFPVENKTNSLIETNQAEFWAFHPVRRALGTGILSRVFFRLTATPFSTAAIYGGMSGVANVAAHVAFKNMFNYEHASPEARTMIFWLCSVTPWVCSALTMRHIYKTKGTHLFALKNSTAVGLGLAVEFLSVANDELLKPPKKQAEKV
jgi:hypothetical protein